MSRHAIPAGGGRLFPRLLLVALAFAPALRAAPVVEMEGTAIIGEQERPRLGFDIPWQKLPPATPPQRPWTRLDPVQARPLDREHFRQWLRLQRPPPSPPIQ